MRGNEVSIFGVLAKYRTFVAQTAPYDALLCTRGRSERGRCNVLARRACGTDERRHGRSKFEKLCVDFWATCETPSFRREDGVVWLYALHMG